MYLKLPECLRICQHCRSNQIENENLFYFIVIVIKLLDNKYQMTSFNLFNDTEKTIFLFNNANSFICEKQKHVILLNLK